ncbi:MAG TPA: hypothetical protein VHN98_06415 [Acidimicrobiales bacterium]|nr:hypothetical protein [Acidimicrobiales bacterium]
MVAAVPRPRLFHFSDDPAIRVFSPQPVRVPSERGPGKGWLNGPLVWAVDEDRQATYLFPRDCPRILLWPTEATTAEDRERWWGTRTCRMIAHVEWDWMRRLQTASIFRYELPPDTFTALDDTWMWVSRDPVTPIAVDRYDDLLGALAAQDVELRIMSDLTPLRGVWDTTLHASGIRLRNARGWNS